MTEDQNIPPKQTQGAGQEADENILPAQPAEQTTSDIPVDSLMRLADESAIGLITNDPLFIATFRNNLKSYRAFNEDYLYWIQGTVIINNKMIGEIKEEYGEDH